VIGLFNGKVDYGIRKTGYGTYPPKDSYGLIRWIISVTVSTTNLFASVEPRGNITGEKFTLRLGCELKASRFMGVSPTGTIT